MSVREFNVAGSEAKTNVVLASITHFEELQDGHVRLYLNSGVQLDVASSARSVRGYVKKALASQAVDEAA